MELYKILTAAAILVITHWSMGFIFFHIGRRTRRVECEHLQSKITELKVENGKLEKELSTLEMNLNLTKDANEEMFEEGRKSIVKETVKEMLDDHERLDFEKIPQKKSIKEEGGEDADNNGNSNSGSRNILLDAAHSS